MKPLALRGSYKTIGLIALGVAMGVGALMLHRASSSGDGGETAGLGHNAVLNIAPPYSNMDELLAARDLIVIGTVGPLVGTHQSPSNDELGEMALPTEYWGDVVWTYSEFEIAVEDVLLDRQDWATSGMPLVLSHPLGPPYPDDDEAYVKTGDRFLFLMSQLGHGYADNIYQVTRGQQDRIVVDGPSPADALGRSVVSASGMSTEDFLDELVAAIARIYPPE